MRNSLVGRLTLLAVVFSLLAASALPAGADWTILRGYAFYLSPTLHPEDAVKATLPKAQPKVTEGEEAAEITGGKHRVYLPKSQAFSDQKAMLPSQLGLNPEEVESISGGRHQIPIPRSKVR